MFPLDLTTVGILIIIIYLLSSIKILREYERGVIFRLGRVLAEPKGPGIILVFAPIDRIVRVSLRIACSNDAPKRIGRSRTRRTAQPARKGERATAKRA